MRIRALLWAIRHPIETYKIFSCDHRDIDLKTLICGRCKKQFRFVGMNEYLGKVDNANKKNSV